LIQIYQIKDNKNEESAITSKPLQANEIKTSEEEKQWILFSKQGTSIKDTNLLYNEEIVLDRYTIYYVTATGHEIKQVLNNTDLLAYEFIGEQPLNWKNIQEQKLQTV